MKKKPKKWPIIAIVCAILILFATAIILWLNRSSYTGDTIPDDYILVFHGGSGEQIYETYIYKTDKQSNRGFSYINVTKTTKSYGSTEWVTKITKRGQFEYDSDAFKIAKENGAYSYVTTPSSDQPYTIEEFYGKFVTN